MLRILETEHEVGVGCLPFNVKDVYNFLSSQKSFKRENDAANLVLKCKHLKSLDLEFQYEYQVDDENRLEYITWCHSTSIRGYQLYGDVVVFDTTYKLNAYDMPIGVWVGVNNHGCSVFFGCCLLRDEQQTSFEWAFKVFLKFMGGKVPKTIITDDDPQIGGAIENICPATKHALCMWHIAKKIPEVLSSVLKSQFKEWNKAFQKLSKLETEEDFDKGWQAMLEEYDLVANGHLRRLYLNRSKWPKPYLRSYFFAGMRTIGKSESMNTFIKHTISSQTHLTDFIDQIGKAVGVLVQKGEQKDMQQKATTLTILTQQPIEIHASKVLTLYAFRKYQNEIVESSSYECYQSDHGFWIVRHAEHVDKW
ncbi:protein FAR1-RELATED SEQUENCE 11-like [Telopea speciosissima]|uniref:protein FAR1-RELATED SEQUENCE 11-like n=1 Tax=Telopea speciosissima TaxID=54955 RepID=UPI001CC4166E|nr:protein FAR1-RELATED SEQUENCE 11-like [Telopea speciosissima]